MNFLKRNANAIIICLLELVIGILLLINPVAFTYGIIIAVGALLTIAGVIDIVNYFRTNAVEASVRRMLVKGLAMLVLGISFIVRPSWLVSTIPLLTIIYGLFLMVAGLGKVQWMVDSLRLKTGKWFLHAISALVSIVCAVIILSSPFGSTVGLWIFTGIALIVEAIIDVVVMIFSKDDSKSDPLQA